MLKGLWDFRPINEKTLGFQKNENLLFMEPHPRDQNWLRVANRYGRVGLVPINYVATDREISPESVIRFAEDAMLSARRDRSQYTDMLDIVRQNIMSNIHNLPEFLAELEGEVLQLRSKAISELSNEDSNRRSSYRPKDTARTVSSATTVASGSKPEHRVGRSAHKSGQQKLRGNAQCSKCSQCEIGLEREELKQSSRREKKVARNNSEPIRSVERLPPEENCKRTTKSTFEISVATDQSLPYTEDYEKNLAGPCGDIGPAISNFQSVTSSGVPPLYTSSSTSRKSSQTQESIPLKKTLSNSNIPACNSSSRKSSTVSISSSPRQCRKLAGEMIEAVRNTTGLSHELSQIAVQTVLQYMQGNLDSVWNEQLGYLLIHLEAPRAISKYPTIITQSSDAQNLRQIFHNLTACKDDEQQRSWALHEDEAMILEYLEQLNIILANADTSISKFVMEEDQYNSVHALVLYYQMETRWTIRKGLLDNFALLSTIDDKAMSVLLNSILPMELAREICESENNHKRMSQATGLLTILLSMAEPMPITHYEHLGVEFLNFILNGIENPPDDDEKFTEDFMHLLFAYNLQFGVKDENLTIAALAERHNANVFTQKLIFYLNREIDPISHLVTHEPKPSHSVFKLATDVFSSAKTAELFYTNDIKVLIDIVTRCLTDLGPGDKRRNSYLKLIRCVVRNSNFSEHQHRRNDLLHCFTSILLEEDPLAVPDQRLIREIATEFPNFFSKN